MAGTSERGLRGDVIDLAPVALAGANWDGIVAAYLVEVESRTGSLRTRNEYAGHIARFREHVCPELAQATTPHVQTFGYAALPRRTRSGSIVEGNPPSPSTTIVRLAALRGLYDFARRQGFYDRPNPADSVARPQLRPPVPKGLSRDEMRALLDAIPRTPAGYRDRAVIVLMLLTGLRREEALALRAGDIARDEAEAVITYTVRVKGGAHRRRELPAPAFVAIVEALAARGETLDGLAPEALLFAIRPNSFYQNLRKYGEAAGLGEITPHTLRHAAAKLRRATGASLEDVQALLGHANIATTARYLARLEGTRDEGWHKAAAAIGL